MTIIVKTHFLFFGLTVHGFSFIFYDWHSRYHCSILNYLICFITIYNEAHNSLFAFLFYVSLSESLSLYVCVVISRAMSSMLQLLLC